MAELTVNDQSLNWNQPLSRIPENHHLLIIDS